MKIYQGYNIEESIGYFILVLDSEGKKKPYRLAHVVRHSPDGFAWGYSGSGPADCALSILADFTGDEDLANKLHQEFKRTYIADAGLVLSIPGDAILEWIESQGFELKTYLIKD